MAHLTQQSLDLLLALSRAIRSYRMGQREEITVDAVELNGLLGSTTKAPYRNKEACAEALGWCANNAYPLVPLVIVMDAGYRHPESALINAAFGVLPRAEGDKRWHEELDRIASCDLEELSRMNAQLEELARAFNPAPAERRRSASPRTSERSAAPKTRATTKTRAANSASSDAHGATRKSASTRAGASAKQPGRTSAQASTRVRVQEIDEERFKQVFSELMALAQREMGDDAGDLPAYFDLLKEPITQARTRWIASLGTKEWDVRDAGSGVLVAALQKTVDDEDAFWIDGANGIGSIARRLRRGLGKEDGTLDFERAVMQLFAGELAVPDFLETMKALFTRQYSFISHLLFLFDGATYVPVASSALEQGLRQLGIEFSLSGNCTWANYSRFLAYLDRIASLSLREGLEMSRADAAFFLYYAGTGTLEVK